MKLSKIINDRSCGYFKVRFANIDVDDVPFENLMEYFNLAPIPDYLEECDFDYAVEVIKTILWKDLAYGIELVKENDAKKRAVYIAQQCYDENTRIYTNGDWSNYHIRKGCNCHSLTESTFDAGVLFVGEKHAACVWVEDED